jgi:hypothetical protein
VVCEPDAATQLSPQNNHLMSERSILSLKPIFDLSGKGQRGQNKPNQRDHRANLADSSLSKLGKVFGAQSTGIGTHRPTDDATTVCERGPRSAKTERIGPMPCLRTRDR